MFIATIKLDEKGEKTLVMKSEDRSKVRGCQLLCEENNIPCEVVKEVKPAVVKFK